MLWVFTGASACVQLKKFDEAITWCNKGLAVSFPKVDSQNNFHLESISLTKSSLQILSAVAAARFRENTARLAFSPLESVPKT